ncbi:hypothetical protein Phi10:1_gp059 [Cellulophaga phage phi10:1]|uniref:Uncharacterized protein n=1 Tax=Cellulophaga phage phi10:1 TaxID=1327981 RepID=S0A0R0_9CAUD|nr:hypothetical protein Phi10:1_gp059 [Cellulophaga phage phi10:1]AGO48400.1 hypothetical protein Phi10:1_gp059 [Cellulophaga phage phi10:1]
MKMNKKRTLRYTFAAIVGLTLILSTLMLFTISILEILGLDHSFFTTPILISTSILFLYVIFAKIIGEEVVLYCSDNKCGVCGQELTEIRGKYPKEPKRKVCACCATEKLEWQEEQRCITNSKEKDNN